MQWDFFLPMHFFVCYAKCTQKRAMHMRNGNYTESVPLQIADRALEASKWVIALAGAIGAAAVCYAATAGGLT